MSGINLYREIAKVACELYEKSGRVEDRDLDNWLEAEKIVLSKYKEPEKRNYERKPFIKVIRYSPNQHLIKSNEIAYEGVTVDISDRGLGMITDCPLKKGDILFFEPAMEVNASVIMVSAVRWAKEIEKDIHRVGLKTYLK